MINFGPKSKVSKKPKKKRKVSSRVSQEPAIKTADGLTPEDIAEINMFGAAIAKMNWEHAKRNWAKTVAEWKKFQKAKPGA
jgi:hypothetical protein